jgi:hypothetical protein
VDRGQKIRNTKDLQMCGGTVCVCICVTGAWALSEGKWELGFLPLQKLRLVACDAGTLRFKWLGSYDTNVHNVVLWILSYFPWEFPT